MANTEQDNLPIPDGYAELLAEHIEVIGRNRVAKLAGINTSTLHRNVHEKALTLTTARKLLDAIRRGYEERGGDAPTIPPPITTVINARHFAFCKLGARLLEYDGLVDEVMTFALDRMREVDADRLLELANDAIKNPK